jgi:hypothetical protein
MQKIIAYLNKHSLIVNSICIAFWLYIIYDNYRKAQLENSFDERKTLFIVPILFICLSVFNMYMAQKRKKS